MVNVWGGPPPWVKVITALAPGSFVTAPTTAEVGVTSVAAAHE
jgi:hypothetical protein